MQLGYNMAQHVWQVGSVQLMGGPEGVAAPEQEQGNGEVRRVDDVVLQRAQHHHRHQHHVRVVPKQAQLKVKDAGSHCLIDAANSLTYPEH